MGLRNDETKDKKSLKNITKPAKLSIYFPFSVFGSILAAMN